MYIREIFKQILVFPRDIPKVRHQFDHILQALKLYLDDYEEVTVDFDTPNTEVGVTHSLNKTPNRFVVVHNITGAAVFPSNKENTEWSSSKIYFESDGANNTAIIKVWAK